MIPQDLVFGNFISLVEKGAIVPVFKSHLSLLPNRDGAAGKMPLPIRPGRITNRDEWVIHVATARLSLARTILPGL